MLYKFLKFLISLYYSKLHLDFFFSRRSYFERNKHLIEIYLDHNQLKFIHYTAFSSLINLEKLHLGHNKLNFQNSKNEISTPFDNLFKLKHLILENNFIKTLFPLSSSSLEELNLSYNNLTVIRRGDIKMKSHNIFVNLRYNQITNIDLGNEDLQTINNTVDLSENPVDCQCHVQKALKKLTFTEEIERNLEESAYGLNCSTPSNFRIIYGVCDFNNERSIRSFCPTQCSCSHQFSNHTFTANCANAGLQHVPLFKIFDVRPDVKAIKLNVENNSITKINRISKKIVELDASSNHIKQIPTNLKLKYLDIRNNLIDEIDFDSLVGIEKISICGNPLISDKLQEIFDLGEDIKAKFSDYSNISCENSNGNQQLNQFSLSILRIFLLQLICFIFISGH